MSVEKASLQLNEHLLSLIGEDQLHRFISCHGFDLEEHRWEMTEKFNRLEALLLYQFARKKKFYKVLQLFWSDPTFRRSFSFLPLEKLDGQYDKLPFPAFLADDISLEQLMGSAVFMRYPSTIVEGIRRILPRYGICLLNNLQQLAFLIKSYKGPVEDFLKLDHLREIDYFEFCPYFLYKRILCFYPLSRVFRLMVDTRDFDFTQSQMLDEKLKSLQLMPPDVIKKILPSKPRNLSDLYSKISKRMLEYEFSDIEFEQKISFANGYEVGGYEILVPKTSDVFIKTAKSLSICVDEYIAEVVHQATLILFLKKEGRIVYVLEIDVNEGGQHEIVQFKGENNDDSMEFEQGQLLRDEILSLLNNGVVGKELLSLKMI